MADRNYIKEVEAALRKKREAAALLSEMRKAEVHEKLPRIKELDLILSTTASKVLTAMMSGGDVEKKVSDIRAENEAIRKERSAILVANGYSADYTDIKHDCENCGDSGYVGINMCSCMRGCIAQMRLEDSELGRLAKDQNFDNFDLSYYEQGIERDSMAYNLKMLKGFAENFSTDTKESWLLIGATGLGKTHLSTAVGVEVIRRGYEVVYKTVQAMIDDFEEVQFKGKNSDMTRAYYDCDLLIIDDMGAEMSNQFTVSCIYNVINARMNKAKPTVISTNFTQKELRERYADRITSRLFGEYSPLVFRGADIRRQKLGGKRK